MKANHARFYWSHLGDARRVLDLGCATGDLGKYKPDGCVVFGLDVNHGLLVEARRHEIVQAWDLDASTWLPFPDAFFDAVVAKDILEHLQKPWRTVAEIRRVLRPGGIAMASVITPRGRRVWSDYTHVRGFTSAAVRQMFADSGLEVTALWPMGAVPLSARLGAIGWLPALLRVPPFGWIWTSSYELTARHGDPAGPTCRDAGRRATR
jgi:SAM-dependent methyltransferase